MNLLRYVLVAYAILSFCILPSAFTLGIARPGSGG